MIPRAVSTTDQMAMEYVEPVGGEKGGVNFSFFLSFFLFFFFGGRERS